MAGEDQFEELLEEFREKVEPLGVTVLRVASAEAAAHALAGWALSLQADCVIVASEVTRQMPGIDTALASAGLRVRASASPAKTRDAPFGVSMGRLAVAETGSVLLSEPSLEDRSVGMLTLAAETASRTSLIPIPRDANALGSS